MLSVAHNHKNRIRVIVKTRNLRGQFCFGILLTVSAYILHSDHTDKMPIGSHSRRIKRQKSGKVVNETPSSSRRTRPACTLIIYPYKSLVVIVTQPTSACTKDYHITVLKQLCHKKRVRIYLFMPVYSRLIHAVIATVKKIDSISRRRCYSIYRIIEDTPMMHLITHTPHLRNAALKIKKHFPFLQFVIPGKSILHYSFMRPKILHRTDFRIIGILGIRYYICRVDCSRVETL